jgi:predicted O-methyltransferase YrrM
MLNAPVTPPAILARLEAETRTIEFPMASDALTGALLRVLVASKPSGNFLELGTGTGMGTAWLLDGMDATARLLTVERNPLFGDIARRHLGTDPRVTFYQGDGAHCILAQEPASFDLIFADTQPGKFQLLDETLALLKSGGMYVIDDLDPRPSWDEGHQPRVEALIASLEARPDLRICKLNWSSGLLIATKI